MKEGYRVATSADYDRVVSLLTEGGVRDVLVRSLFRIDEAAYPLCTISKAPYRVTYEGIEGYSLEGERCTIRIPETPLHNIELRRGEADWIAPEMASVILLIPE